MHTDSEITYYKKERKFETPIKPFIASEEEQVRRSDLLIYEDASKRKKLFSGLVSIFFSSEDRIEATARDEDGKVISEVKVDTSGPPDIPYEPGSGFMHSAGTKVEYQERGISRVLRSLLTQTFAKNYETNLKKDKIVGLVLKTNFVSLKARFFMVNPETNELYYTTVTGIQRQPVGGDFYIVTTYLNRPSDMKTQTALYEKYALLEKEA